MVERETVCQLESRSLSEPPVRIASRCYTSDHVVTAFQQEGYFGRSRVGGYSRLEIGGSATVKEVDFRQCRATEALREATHLDDPLYAGLSSGIDDIPVLCGALVDFA